jgi:ADP-L-glycero-D-manno-heptose 6-epimerase
MYVIVTGGAGFIGSCLVRMLNDKGIKDILIADDIARTEKWKNIRNKQFSDYIHKGKFLDVLPKLKGKISHIIHMGACSSTTELDFDYLYHNNFEYTKALWNFAAENKISFLYASSAATYGDGTKGFDDQGDIYTLEPLNGYGYSKQLFDLWADKQTFCPPQHVGLKFFNVYGPNEYCKGSMASVVYHAFNQIKDTGEVKLFKSYLDKYPDGGQMRDFIYVKDICSVIAWLMEHPEISGLYNLGTGRARTFTDLGQAVFAALGHEEQIRFVEMPETLRPKYQYFTEAKMNKLRSAGYDMKFWSLEEGIRDYVCNYLEHGYATY